MRRFSSMICLLLGLSVAAQDRVILDDGSERKGRITEVNPDNIVIATSKSSEKIPKASIILAEFGNGVIERYRFPTKDAVYGKPENHAGAPEKQSVSDNLVSVNTLALVNADFTVAYERLNKRRNIGVGLLGGLNFNRYALLPNFFIAILANGRKTGDGGIFLNYYPSAFTKRTTLSMGGMLKYTGFSYSSVREDSLAGGGTNITYTSAKGFQLAWMVTMGSHTAFRNHFYIRSLLAVGACVPAPAYREQLSYRFNRLNPEQPTSVNFYVLPKAYLMLSAGFHF